MNLAVAPADCDGVDISYHVEHVAGDAKGAPASDHHMGPACRRVIAA